MNENTTHETVTERVEETKVAAKKATTSARKPPAKKVAPARAVAKKAPKAPTAPAGEAAPAMPEVRLHVPTVEELREMVGKIEVPNVREARVDAERFVDEVRTDAEMLVDKVRDLLARIEIPTTVGALRADTEKLMDEVRADTEKLIEELRADTEKFLTEVRADAERFIETATDTLSQVPARANEVAHDAQEQVRSGYHKVLESIR
jgi:ElaB/YqjD/DUF883 family membrane-anchored ribosome-binding protein